MLRPALRAFVCTASMLAASAASARADTLYATSSPVNPSLLAIDPATGIPTTSVAISGEEALFGGLTLDGTNLYSIDGYNDGNSDRTFIIDSTTGAGAVVGNTGFNWNFRSVEIHPLTGVLYATTDNVLYRIDKATGVATQIAPITGATVDQATALAINQLGEAYMADIGGQGLFRLDLATGALTHLGDMNNALLNIVQDLAFDSSGKLWAVGISGGLFQIDIATVSASLLFPSGGYGGIAFKFDCPQPQTYCQGKVNSLGCTPSIGMTGQPSASAGSGCMLSTVNLIGGKNGLFFHSTTGSLSAPFHGGTLCVKAPIKRHTVHNSSGTPGTCNGVYTEDLNVYIAAGTDPALIAGAGIWVQTWSRDPADPFTDSLSDAVTATVCP